MTAQALWDHVTGELHREATVLKERLKMREERVASRGDGKGSLVASSLQSGTNKQADEIKKLRSDQGASRCQGFWDTWSKGST